MFLLENREISQAVDYKGVMTQRQKKEKCAWTLPKELKDEFEVLAKQHGGKQFWVVASVAVVALLEMSPEILREYVALVRDADSYTGFADLVERVRAKKLKDVAQRNAIVRSLVPPPGVTVAEINKPGGHDQIQPPKPDAPQKGPRGRRS